MNNWLVKTHQAYILNENKLNLPTQTFYVIHREIEILSES